MSQIQNKLDYLENENQKTKINFDTFKAKRNPKVVKDISESVKKVINIETSIVNNIEKKVKPFNTEVKKKSVIWL